MKKDLARRMRYGGFSYPLGVFPEEGFNQRVGYDSKYLKEDECFYYQVALPHERLMNSLISLFDVLPGKVYLVLKMHSGDYYQDFDTYISEEIIDRKELVEWIEQWKDVALDDGFFGIGMFVENGVEEVFLDEHKTIHVYHSDPDLMEKTLDELNIEFVMGLDFFWDGAHYHESLPLDDGIYENDYLNAFECLADRYELYLDEDDEENTDDEGSPFGINCWKVDIRGYSQEGMDILKHEGFYTTLYLNACSRQEVVDIVDEYMGEKNERVDLFLRMARVPSELLTSTMMNKNFDPMDPCVWFESKRVAIN
ncbi:hypothetical protein MNBD_NITROSPINAE02-1832 [hydrothermal vent metagenome]|uniref:Uncharacterized protein n=1 Tax=hydrothermal vent metagenome TaxID=652676 RepID=A0A3B1CC92_9ZZZZ